MHLVLIVSCTFWFRPLLSHFNMLHSRITLFLKLFSLLSLNYRLFLNSVISALVGIILVVIIASYVFIEFFLDPSKLRSDKHFQGQCLWTG